MNFPDDENGEVLKEMFEAGIDFSQTYNVDFYAAFEFEERGQEAIDALQKMTFSEQSFADVKLQKPEQGGGVELVATIPLQLEYQTITDIDNAFTAKIEKLRGFADGWGVDL
ncbi:ribonuclease E inhibitor RraB [Algibacillus agarilyticus]|uniref:ribonuclease E inhibitor RraB n=1 Tax=Algibacillus agarilyticus TaxID=2234133 RepID=UPI00130065D9|nr:ribonuclease E inhibitor RraB [Algibacillus agarilyticus]